MSEETQGTKRQFEEEFKALPLDEKLGSLFRMEAAALEETFHVVADAGSKAFHKAAEVIDDFGQKVQAEFNKNRECKTAPSEADNAYGAPTADAKPKGGKKKSTKPATE
ncbi:MAG TPA: hypothetical protein VGO43_09250 [Pyrinomonadaceae bacterium]|nr:hypothetical protein [Pyrinomonadaceae bacterium]